MPATLDNPFSDLMPETLDKINAAVDQRDYREPEEQANSPSRYVDFSAVPVLRKSLQAASMLLHLPPDSVPAPKQIGVYGLRGEEYNIPGEYSPDSGIVLSAKTLSELADPKSDNHVKAIGTATHELTHYIADVMNVGPNKLNAVGFSLRHATSPDQLPLNANDSDEEYAAGNMGVVAQNSINAVEGIKSLFDKMGKSQTATIIDGAYNGFKDYLSQLKSPSSDQPAAGPSPSPSPAPLSNPAPEEYGPFSDLVVNRDDPTPLTAQASKLLPNELIGGGTADAPAFQRVNGQLEHVPIGAAVSTRNFGPFSDLVSTEADVQSPVTSYARDFGIFDDLVPPSPAPETEKVVAESMQGIESARNAVGLLTRALNEKWGSVDQVAAQAPLSAMQAEYQAAGAAKDAMGIIAPVAYDKLKEFTDYVAPGVLDQMNNSLSQFQVPKEFAKQVIEAAGEQSGLAPLNRLLPVPIIPEHVSKGLTESAAGQIESLTAPETYLALGAMALVPAVGAGAIFHRAISFGFAAQAAYGMTNSIMEATKENDPQKFWKDIGDVVAQGAIATAATLHGAKGSQEAAQKSQSLVNFETTPDVQPHPAQDLIAERNRLFIEELPKHIEGTNGRAWVQNAINELDQKIRDVSDAHLRKVFVVNTTDETLPQPAAEGGETKTETAVPQGTADLPTEPAPAATGAAVRINDVLFRGEMTEAALDKARSELAPHMSADEFLKVAQDTDPTFSLNQEAETETPKLQPGQEQGALPDGDVKTPEQLDAERQAEEARLADLQRQQDVRVGAAKPLVAGEDVRPEADMFLPEDQPDIFDQPKAKETDAEYAARLKEERSLLREAREGQQRGGDELLAAIQKGGGLPSKTSPHYTADLFSLTENPKAKRLLLRKTAPHPDRLTETLREAGFDFETPSDMLSAVEERLRTGKDHFPQLVNAPEVFGFGPGAAAKGELDNMGREPISIANKRIDAERRARGAEPIMSVASKGKEMIWNEAMAQLDRDPQKAQNLVDNINAGTVKATTDVEQGMLLHEEIRLKNEKAMEADRANDQNATPEERADADAKYSALEARIDATERAARASGTEWSSAGRARQIAAFDDFTHAALETRERIARGRPLEREESLKLKAQADEIAKLREDLAKAEDAGARDQAMEVFSNLIRETFKESKKQAKAGKGLVDILHSQRDAAKARIIARRGRLNAGIDPTSLLDEAIIGASHIADGLVKLGEWSEAMVRDFGERIKPYLSDLFDRAKEIHDSHAKLVKPKAEKPSPMDKVSAASEEGTPLTHKMVFDLAREHVNAGVEGLDAVMKAVHNDLRDFFPDATERDVRDAFTQYGKRTYPSKEQDLVKLREYRRLGQLQSALEDVINKNQKPAKTGLQRDAVSQAVREKTKELKYAMRAAGFETTGPEQLASVNKARETALTNRIEDIEKEIRTGERPKPGVKVADSARVTELKAKRDRLAKQLQALRDADPEVIAAKTAADLESKRKALQKQIDDLKAKATAGKPAAKPGEVNRPGHPALEGLMQERDKLRQQLAEARKKPEAQKAAEAMQKRLEKMNDTINERLAKLSVGDLSRSGKNQPVNRPLHPDLEATQQELDRVNKQIADARKAAGKTKDQITLDRIKKTLDKRIEDAERRLRENDYSKPTRRATVLDKEAVNKKAALAQLQQKINSNIERLRLANRTGFEKVQDAAVKWARIAKLASPRVFPKLIEAGLIRIVTNPISRVLAQPLRLIPGLTRKAPAQLRLSARIEAGRVAAVLSSGPEAFRKLIGRSKLDALSKKKLLDNEMFNFVGNAHGAIKEPVRQGEYRSAVKYYTEQALADGLDIREPAVQTSIVSSAVADANREIFMGENPFSTFFVSNVVAALRNQKFTGARTLANAVQFVMPIVRVSSNIAVHTARLGVGLPESMIRLATALKKGELANGAEKLSHEDAQAITRSFSAGVLGTVLAAYAWQNPNQFGGLYGEQDAAGKNQTGMKPNEIKIAGVTIPGWLNHAPELQWLNTIASARRVYDHYYAKGYGAGNSLTEAVAYSLMAPVKNLPFIDAWLRLFSEHQSAGRVFGQTVRSAVVPGGKSIMDLFDQQERAPKTFMDEMKLAFPGWRESVPVKGESSSNGSATSSVRRSSVRR